MGLSLTRIKIRYLACFLFIAAIVSACGGSYEETISGVKIPVPSAMKKSSEKPADISILGFEAGTASFQGNVEEKKVIEFYKQEMPARGWRESMHLISGGAMLAYSKEGKTVLIGIGKQGGEAILTLTVGGVGK